MTTALKIEPYVPQIGDVVLVPDGYCRGCDRPTTDRRGIVVGRVEDFKDIALFALGDDGSPRYVVRVGHDTHLSVFPAAGLQKLTAGRVAMRRAYRQGDRVETTTSNGDRWSGGHIAGFVVEFEDGSHRRLPWDAEELRLECDDPDRCLTDPEAIHIDH